MTDEITPEITVPGTADFPSQLRRVFIGSRGIRAGWCLAIFLPVTVGAILLARIALVQVPAFAAVFNQNVLSPSLEFLVEIPTAVCLLLCSSMMARIEKRHLSDYGLSLAGGAGKRFLGGLIWGFVALSAVIFLIGMLHGFSIEGLAIRGLTLVKYATLWAIGFLLVGFVEEFLFRGYVQSTLSEAIGFWPAAVIWSLAFGAIHLTNAGENLVGISEVFLTALFLCLTLRRTGALWFAMGFHAAWDYSETFLFSVRDSGFAATGSLLNSSFHGAKWLTGGKVGPEASVMSAFVLILAIVLFHFSYSPASSRPQGATMVAALFD